jgi:hypothetical protein
MIERWYKAPVDCLFDVRIARMPAGLFKVWHQLQALASLNSGALPTVEQIAYSVRSSAATVAKRLESLAERGLAILQDGVWRLVDALAKETPADVDAETPLSGAERTRLWRARRAGEPPSGDAVLTPSDETPVTPVTPCDAPREENKREDFPRDARRDGMAFIPRQKPAEPQRTPGVWIAQDAPEWEPWAAFWRATRGKSPPTDKRGGWRFPHRVPPDRLAVAAE